MPQEPGDIDVRLSKRTWVVARGVRLYRSAMEPLVLYVWDWRRNSDGSVAPKSVAVRCSAKVTLPRLAADVELTAELLAAWEAYQERLTTHELNHLKHLRTVAPSIAERIVLWGHRHGAITVQKANDIAQGVLLEVKELDRSYDVQTAHGRSEGLWSVTD